MIITNREELVQRSASAVTACHYSPHDFTRMLLKVSKEKRQTTVVTSRCLNRVDFDYFNDVLTNTDWSLVYQSVTTNDKWGSFLEVFTPHLNAVAPARRINLRNPSAPPVSADTRVLMTRRRDALARGLRDEYKLINKQTRAAIRRDCRDYIRQQIAEAGHSGMWRCIKPIIGSKMGKSVIPNVHPDTLNEYFVNVGPATAASVSNRGAILPAFLPRVMTCSFMVLPVSLDELMAIMSTMNPTTSCGLDDVSTLLLQKCYRGISCPLLNVINSCLADGTLPGAWKHALVTALPKTSNLNDPSTFRPISVVPAIAKLVERIVHNQLSSYFNQHDLFSHTQHGYRTNFSTETALTVMIDKIFTAMDTGDVALLVLIDLSKCFDVVDHELLLSKLKLYNVDTKWFESYLRGHTQQVQIRYPSGHTVRSRSLPNGMGVFQGTALGPLLYSIFSNDLALHSKDATVIQYADDTQILVTGKKRQMQQLVTTMENTLSVVMDWFNNHSMKVNTAKTQLIVFGTKAMLRHMPPVSVRFGSAVIKESPTVRNLGLVMDKHLTFEPHIDQLVTKSTGILIALSHAKHALPKDTLVRIVSALVLSHVRYCVALYGTHGTTQLHRVQKLINFCARVVSGRRKFDHISDIVKDLRWLNAKQLVEYHTLCLLKKVLLTGQPSDIAAMFVRADHEHDTRQSNQLRRPRAVSNSGVRRFSYRASDLYNRLPPDIRDSTRLCAFKRQLMKLLLRDTRDDT